MFLIQTIENNSIKFYDVSYVEAKLNYKKDTVSVELTKYSQIIPREYIDYFRQIKRGSNKKDY